MNKHKTEIFVPLENKIFKLAYLLEEQRILQRSREAQQLHRLRCNCHRTGANGPSLVVRQKSGSTYFVAKMPNTGAEHKAGCNFAVVKSSLSGAGEYERAIRETDDGTTINVSFPLTKAASKKQVPQRR